MGAGADRAGFFASSAVPFAIAREGRLVDVNEAFARALGFSAQELREMPAAELMHPEDRASTAHLLESLDDVRSRVWVNRYRTRDGGWRALRWVVWRDRDRGVTCGVAHDVTDEQAAADQLSRLAYDDQLTGLANRTRLLETLARCIGGGPRAVGVLFLDVDGFKAVNDGHGHATGDALLRELGERLRGAVRRTDMLARLGGDEFVVVLPDLPEAIAEVRVAVRAAAAQLLAALDGGFDVAGGVRLGGSVGGAAWPWSGATPAELLAAADAAMYEAKRAPGQDCALHATIA